MLGLVKKSTLDAANAALSDVADTLGAKDGESVESAAERVMRESQGLREQVKQRTSERDSYERLANDRQALQTKAAREAEARVAEAQAKADAKVMDALESAEQHARAAAAATAARDQERAANDALRAELTAARDQRARQVTDLLARVAAAEAEGARWKDAAATLEANQRRIRQEAEEQLAAERAAHAATKRARQAESRRG